MTIAKVLIEIQGGLIQAIYSNNKNTEIVIIDQDMADVGESGISEIKSPDGVGDDLYSFYSGSEPRLEIKLLFSIFTLNYGQKKAGRYRD